MLFRSPNMGDDIRITVIATGFERNSIPRRVLERNTRENKRPEPVSFSRPMESVSVLADVQPGETKSAPPPAINKDDLDIPTFLRNRR